VERTSQAVISQTFIVDADTLFYTFIMEVDLGTYYILKIVHLTGIFFVFSALGGHMFRAAIGSKEDNPLPKFIGMFHKVASFLY
jgi:hypothetical protein